MESVLVGVDSSKASRRALAFALKRAQINEWKVSVVHVINWTPFSFPTLQEIEDRPVERKHELEHAESDVLGPLLEWAEKKDLIEGVEISTETHFGRPFEILSELADEEDHDLIVVGRTGDSNLKAAIFGTTASRLVQHAPVPVVVVP